MWPLIIAQSGELATLIVGDWQAGENCAELHSPNLPYSFDIGLLLLMQNSAVWRAGPGTGTGPLQFPDIEKMTQHVCGPHGQSYLVIYILVVPNFAYHFEKKSRKHQIVRFREKEENTSGHIS